MNAKQKEFAGTVILAIEKGMVKSKQELEALKLRIGGQLRLPEMPSNPDMLALAKKPSRTISELLSIKP